MLGQVRSGLYCIESGGLASVMMRLMCRVDVKLGARVYPIFCEYIAVVIVPACMRSRVGTNRSGTHRTWDTSTVGRIVKGTHRPRISSEDPSVEDKSVENTSIGDTMAGDTSSWQPASYGITTGIFM
jgi:hypothetical protein